MKLILKYKCPECWTNQLVENPTLQVVPSGIIVVTAKCYSCNSEFIEEVKNGKKTIEYR